MTASTDRRGMRFLSALHLLAVLGLMVWWGHFYWQRGPVKALLARAAAPTPTRRSLTPVLPLTDSISRKSETLTSVLHAAAADVAGGCVVILLLAIGSGVTVRRLEIWLQARTSGQAVALGATRLSDATLEANTDRNAVLK